MPGMHTQNLPRGLLHPSPAGSPGSPQTYRQRRAMAGLRAAPRRGHRGRGPTAPGCPQRFRGWALPAAPPRPPLQPRPGPSPPAAPARPPRPASPRREMCYSSSPLAPARRSTNPGGWRWGRCRGWSRCPGTLGHGGTPRAVLGALGVWHWRCWDALAHLAAGRWGFHGVFPAPGRGWGVAWVGHGVAVVLPRGDMEPRLALCWSIIAPRTTALCV